MKGILQKILVCVLSVVMFTGAVAINPNVLSTLEADATTTAASNNSGGINVNGIRDGKVENINIADYTEVFDEDAEDILREFGLDQVEHSYGDDDGWYKDSATYYPIYEIWRSEDGSFTIPDSYRTSIQIKNAAKADMIYLDTLCEKYLQVTTNGTLTANYENNIPSNSNQEYIYDCIRIYYKQKYVTVQIHIMDYDLEWQDKYVYNTIAEYVNSHTDNSMTDYEKMSIISEWLQTFPYECPGRSSYEILTGAGGGDCWTFPMLVKKLQIIWGGHAKQDGLTETWVHLKHIETAYWNLMGNFIFLILVPNKEKQIRYYGMLQQESLKAKRHMYAIMIFFVTNIQQELQYINILGLTTIL